MEVIQRIVEKIQQLSPLNKGILAFAVYRFIRYLRWRRSITSRIPGPAPSLLLGNVVSFYRAGGFNERFFKKLHADHGDIAAFFIGPTICNISVAHPDLMREVYRKTVDRPLETYMFLNYLGDDNLMFSKGEQTLKLRAAYQEVLIDEENMKRLAAVTFEEVRKSADEWSTMKDGVDAFEATGPLVYNILGRTVFNRRWLDSPEGAKIFELHSHLIETVNTYLLLYAMPRWFRFLWSMLSPGYRRYLKTITALRKECGKLLEERREAIKNGEYADDVDALTFLCKGELFENNKHLAITTMLGFLNGGYDTTHSTMFWLLYHMAKYPEKAEKLHNEVIQEVGRSGTPDMKTLKRMDYVNAFLKESMRMVATVPVNQRVNLSEDFEVGGIVVPKGVNVNLPKGVMFKNEEFFGPNPEKFLPERFMGKSESAVRARKCLSAFGGWTRICAGIKFAESTELPAFIVAIVQKVTVHLVDPNEKGSYDIEAGVNQPFPKFKLRFEKRKVFPTW